MMFRDVANGRPYSRAMPSPYVFNQVFPERVMDTRYNKTFQTIQTQIAQADLYVPQQFLKYHLVQLIKSQNSLGKAFTNAGISNPPKPSLPLAKTTFLA